ncbi:hypothetical protein [Streptomyces prunicolor]|uniref:Transposase n=1 Tax=Streptomyces prunicolor TaxID=67348 RepID=A0ABU4FD88_9ACTN|nr:hypothetical protein [Streptomyces prunicolor]MDV7217956.1 hypothetical protein [Streptomyces prunicolor]
MSIDIWIGIWIVERNPKDKGFLPQPERWVAEINRARWMQVVAATPTAAAEAPITAVQLVG